MLEDMPPNGMSNVSFEGGESKAIRALVYLATWDLECTCCVPLLEECLQHYRHKRNPIMMLEICDAIG